MLELEGGTFADDGGVTLEAWVERWLEHKRVGTKPVKASAIRSYEKLLKQHVVPALGRKGLAAITIADVQALCDSLAASGRLTASRRGEPLSPRTVRAIMQSLGAYLKHAMRTQLLSRNVVALVELPRMRTKKMVALDVSQARRLVTAAKGTRLLVPIVVAVATGLRRGELFGLKWSDIDFEKRQLTVRRQIGRGGVIDETTKSEAGARDIALPMHVIDALRTHCAAQLEGRLAIGTDYVDRGFVFANQFGMPWNPDGISTLYSRIVRDAGVPKVRFHDLRHSAASIMIAEGVPITVVADVLGHADKSVTMRIYAHALPNGKAAAAETMERLLS